MYDADVAAFVDTGGDVDAVAASVIKYMILLHTFLLLLLLLLLLLVIFFSDVDVGAAVDTNIVFLFVVVVVHTQHEMHTPWMFHMLCMCIHFLQLSWPIPHVNAQV